MDAKKLEILVTAIDIGSFSKASEVVGYTQSGLTHLVDSIEKDIGVKIIKRDAFGIHLTKDGEQLMPSIRDYIRANGQLENNIKLLKEAKKETIRIASYSSITLNWMPEILYRFKRLCPEVNVDLRMVDHALEPFELLEKGETDVIFASRQNYAFCDWTPLYEEKLYAVLPKSYHLKNKETFNLEEFNNLDFLMPYGKFDLEINKIMAKVGIKLKYSTPRVDDETLIRMISRELGVSIMSELMIKGRTKDVICLPISPSSTRELGFGIYKGQRSITCINELKKCVLDFINSINK